MATGEQFVLAIDQGTSSSRAIIFSASTWDVVVQHQVEFASIYPDEGWCEQDPMLILDTVTQCLDGVAKQFKAKGYDFAAIKAAGITNQRETTVAWDKKTGEPLHNAIVWFDARTKQIVDDIIKQAPEGQDVIKKDCGLPVSTYFSGSKMKWLLKHVDAVKNASLKGTLQFGTIDTWLIWNLTGKKHYVTDVTNASRTMLMNINTLKWDSKLCDFFGISVSSLPEIKSSGEVYGNLSYDKCPFPGIPVAGCLGDQQAALVGQKCFSVGTAKSTYGTGCFMLYNVGEQVVYSNQGLLTTVAYQFGQEAPVYALEGSIATTGSAITWLKNIGIIKSPKESGELAAQVKDTGGVYFVPAFNGLFAPHWRSDARGTIVGLTQYTRREHICRATLEAVAFQVLELLKGMEKDSGSKLKTLLVDGGMTMNNLLMQIQADFLGIEVVRPFMVETTSLGAAIAAAKTVGLWKNEVGKAKADENKSTIFYPAMEDDVREAKFARWMKAIEKSFGWEES